MISEEMHLKLLRMLERDPQLSQRTLARELGVSLGKTNYCLRALVEKGLVKARNFRGSRNKLAYAYILTPRGVQQKAELTAAFLRRKQTEFDALKREIEELRDEVSRLDRAGQV